MKDEIQLIQGDCLDWMRSQPDGIMDLTICSPPYEDARTYGIGFQLKGKDYIDWCVDRFLECYRITKGLTAWVIEGRTRKFQWTAAPVLLQAALHERGVKLRKPPIFYRHGIMGSGGPDWLRNDYEFVVCASHGRLPYSNNTAMGKPPKYAPGGEMSYRDSDGTRRNQWGGTAGNKRGSRNKHGERDSNVRPSHEYSRRRQPGETDVQTRRKSNGERVRDGVYKEPAIANPGNVIKCNVGGGHMGHKLAHENEAPYPLSLVEFFVKSFSPPGGLVFDPFVGSGTTMHGAWRHGRRGIGIDVRPEQILLSQTRMADVMKTENNLFRGTE